MLIFVVKSLENLLISDNEFGDSCCPSLSKCLHSLPRIRHLNISSCNFSGKFFEYNHTVFRDAIQGLNYIVITAKTFEDWS